MKTILLAKMTICEWVFMRNEQNSQKWARSGQGSQELCKFCFRPFLLIESDTCSHWKEYNKWLNILHKSLWILNLAGSRYVNFFKSIKQQSLMLEGKSLLSHAHVFSYRVTLPRRKIRLNSIWTILIGNPNEFCFLKVSDVLLLRWVYNGRSCSQYL